MLRFEVVAEVEQVLFSTIRLADSTHVDQLVALISDEETAALGQKTAQGTKHTTHSLLLSLNSETFNDEIKERLGSYGRLASRLLQEGVVDVAVASASAWFCFNTPIIARVAGCKGGQVNSSPYWRNVTVRSRPYY